MRSVVVLLYSSLLDSSPAACKIRVLTIPLLQTPLIVRFQSATLALHFPSNCKAPQKINQWFHFSWDVQYFWIYVFHRAALLFFACLHWSNIGGRRESSPSERLNSSISCFFSFTQDLRFSIEYVLWFQQYFPNKRSALCSEIVFHQLSLPFHWCISSGQRRSSKLITTRLVSLLVKKCSESTLLSSAIPLCLKIRDGGIARLGKFWDFESAIDKIQEVVLRISLRTWDLLFSSAIDELLRYRLKNEIKKLKLSWNYGEF